MRGVTKRDWELFLVERRRLEIVMLGAAYQAQRTQTPAALQHAIQEVIARLGLVTREKAVEWVSGGRPSLSRKLTIRRV